MQTTNSLTTRKDPHCVGAVRTAAAIQAAVRWHLALTGVIVSVSLAAEVARAQRPATDKSVMAYMAVEAHFASLGDYQPGDLVTRSQVAEALAKAADAGAEIPNAERILAASVPDVSFLARELSTPAGRKFMRKVARHPGAFSRLDRLSSISRGQTIVRDLIRSAEGDKFIEYLTTTRGGRQLGSSLAAARHGTDLNESTGRIYTAEDLLAALDQMQAARTGQAR